MSVLLMQMCLSTSLLQGNRKAVPTLPFVICLGATWPDIMVGSKTLAVLATGLFLGRELPSTNTFILLLFHTDFIDANLILNLEYKIKIGFQLPSMAKSADR